MEPQRFVVLLADGTWDGWRVRWAPSGDAQRAIAVDAPHVEEMDIHWDVRVDPSGGRTLERPGGYRIRLSALTSEAMTVAQTRLAKVGDVFADCERARGCFKDAPASARNIIDVDTLYSAQACAAIVKNVCRERSH
jgi:hypothetical protein